MNQAVDMLRINDTDLLKSDQVEPFRYYLLRHKCKTRKGNGNAQLLFVRTSGGWAVVQKGAGGTIKTPIGLRPVIEDFLKTPLNRSLLLAQRMCRDQQVELGVTIARGVAESAPAPATVEGKQASLGSLLASTVREAAAEVDFPLASLEQALSKHDPVAAIADAADRGTFDYSSWPFEDAQAPRCANTGSGDQPIDPAKERSRQWAEFGKLVERVDEELKHSSGPHILLSPELRERAMKGGLMICSAPAADLQHLQDLRDDFAIHCPLPMLEGEDLATYADRRWAYADLMMAKRYPVDADK